MIGQVTTKDGQKIVEPISGSIPTGNPVGSFLYTYKKIQPRNYLYCDGSTFNASQYPALYLYLGTNVLPDYRECTVYVYIKAVDGVDISDEDTFLDTVKNFVEEKNSYSTTEMLTGGTWIDGKPIYRLCEPISGSVNPNAYSNVGAYIPTNMDFLIKAKVTNNFGSANLVYWDSNWKCACKNNVTIPSGTYLIAEYTKTTD